MFVIANANANSIIYLFIFLSHAGFVYILNYMLGVRVGCILYSFCQNDCKMYLNWFPCIECTRAIIQSGIKYLIVPNKPDFNHHRWGKQFKISEQMLNEAKIDTP